MDDFSSAQLSFARARISSTDFLDVAFYVGLCAHPLTESQVKVAIAVGLPRSLDSLDGLPGVTATTAPGYVIEVGQAKAFFEKLPHALRDEAVEISTGLAQLSVYLGYLSWALRSLDSSPSWSAPLGVGHIDFAIDQVPTDENDDDSLVVGVFVRAGSRGEVGRPSKQIDVSLPLSIEDLKLPECPHKDPQWAEKFVKLRNEVYTRGLLGDAPVVAASVGLGCLRHYLIGAAVDLFRWSCPVPPSC